MMIRKQASVNGVTASSVMECRDPGSEAIALCPKLYTERKDCSVPALRDDAVTPGRRALRTASARMTESVILARLDSIGLSRSRVASSAFSLRVGPGLSCVTDFCCSPDKVDKVEEIEKYPFWRGSPGKLFKGLVQGKA